MDKREYNKIVKSVTFGREKDRFSKVYKSKCLLTLTDGFSKKFDLDEDYAHIAKILSENGANPIKEYTVKEAVSKEGNDYVGLFITLTNDMELQFLINSRTVDVFNLIYDRQFPAVNKTQKVN